jgi:exodeoxyribonuclease VII large subunit
MADEKDILRAERSFLGASRVPEGIKVCTVSELTQEVKGLLEDGFPSVWVEGEVSNLARPNSGHLYLTLKDAQSQLRAVIWRGIALRLRFEPRDGLEVIVRGRLTVYAPRGEYQLVIEELHPKGVGALELALRQLREKLFRLGYFDPGRKRPLPRFPRRAALVTSPTGAAVRDMLEIFGRRWSALEVWVCPVRVQGEGAAEEIARGIRLVNRVGGPGPTPVDVLIVGRGGGSLEDLWAFNEECVARAIYESRIPVVSAVGHEVDVTIADLVADCRALTPSEAAERVAPDGAEVRAWLRELAGQLPALLGRRVELARGRLDELARRPAFRLPLERVRDQERRLDDWGERLGRAVKQRLVLARQGVEAVAARLETLSPLNVLGRGYSLTRTEADQVVRSPSQVRPGDRLVTQVQHGRIISRVEEAGETRPTPDLGKARTGS